MKILHVTPSYWPAARYGGTIRSVHGLCRALAARSHQVDVFTTNVDGPVDSDVPLETPVGVDGVRVWYHSTAFRRLYWSPGMARRLASAVHGYDVVHAHSVFLWPTAAAARQARRAGVPYVISPRGMLVRDLVRRKSRFVKSAWIALVERGNIERAAAIHATSALEASEMAAFGFRLPRVAVVPNGVDAGEGGAGQPSAEVKRLLAMPSLVVFVGRLNWKKGIDRLLRALSAVPEAYLAVVGNDEENYRPTLERVAREAGVESRVAFTGPLFGRDKRALLEGAKAFVLPSHSENFGNVVLEAMDAGCPVVVTPGVGLSEAVSRSGAGVVSAADPEALAGALRRLLADPAARARMGEAGRRAVRDEFSWPAVAARMESLYKEIAR